jgi:hypothetical protein
VGHFILLYDFRIQGMVTTGGQVLDMDMDMDMVSPSLVW